MSVLGRVHLPRAPVHTQRLVTHGASRMLGLACELKLEEAPRQFRVGDSRPSGFHIPPHPLCSHVAVFPCACNFSFSECKAHHPGPLLRPDANETAGGHGVDPRPCR